MSGEYLPPVVARITGDTDGLVAAVARAKGALDALKASGGTVRVGFDASAASLAKATAAANAMTTATNQATTATRGFWHWVGIAHNILTVFGANIIADTIGIIAFGVGATLAIGPVITAYKNLGQTYGYLTPLQKAATVQLTSFMDQFQRATHTGIFATFTGLLDMVKSHIGTTGGVIDQASIAFENFVSMLRQSFSSGPWQQLFSRSSSVIQKDLTALFALLTAILNLIPVLFHDFNGLGLWVLSSATAILHLVAALGNADPSLVRFAAVVFLVYRALKAFSNTAIGTSVFTAIGKATGIASVSMKDLGAAASLARTEGLLPAASALLGVGEGAIAATGGLALAATGGLALGFALDGVKNQANSIVTALAAQDNATGTNVAGYQKLASQLQANISQGQAYVGASRQLEGALLQQSAAQKAAAQTAQVLGGNLSYLEQTYHLTQMQAYQLAKATGTDLTQAFAKGGGAAQATRLKISAYEQTVKASQNPTSVLGYDLGRAANTALQLDDRVTALTNAFNALLTPFASVIQDTVTWKQGNSALEKAVDKANGKVGYANNLQQTAAGLLATSINNTINLSTAILQQTGSMQKAAGPVLKEIGYLESLHSKSKLVTQGIQILQQYLDNLHSKAITISVNTQYTQIGQPGNLPYGVVGNHATGTQHAPPGWSWVGERGPELMYLRGGEKIAPHETSMAMAASAGSGGQIVDRQPIVVMLDGQVLYQAVETRVFEKNTQNGMRTKNGSVQGRFGTR